MTAVSDVLIKRDDAGREDVEHDIHGQPAQAANAAKAERHRTQLFAADDAHEFQEAAGGPLFRRFLHVGTAHDAHQDAIRVDGRYAEQRPTIEESLQDFEAGRVANLKRITDHHVGEQFRLRREQQIAKSQHADELAAVGDDVRILHVERSVAMSVGSQVVEHIADGETLCSYARYSVIMSPPAESGGYDISRRAPCASSAGIAARIADASSMLSRRDNVGPFVAGQPADDRGRFVGRQPLEHLGCLDIVHPIDELGPGLVGQCQQQPRLIRFAQAGDGV